jgi:hypothetical protein
MEVALMLGVAQRPRKGRGDLVGSTAPGDPEAPGQDVARAMPGQMRRIWMTLAHSPGITLRIDQYPTLGPE